MRAAALLGFIATAFASSEFAHSYDSLTRYDLGVTADLAPVASASASDGGLWLLAPGSSDTHQLVRLDASGTRNIGLHLPTRVDPDNSDRFTIYPLADGGVLELDTHNRSSLERACILRSITRDGALRFERDVRQPFCRLNLNRPGLAPYLLSNVDGAVLLSEDGSLASSFLPNASETSLIRAEFVNNDILLLRSNETRTGYVLSRANDRGAPLWSTLLTNVRFEQNVSVLGLSDGRALALIADPAKLQLRFYSATGVLTETREIVMPELAQAAFGVWALDSQGNHAISLSFTANSVASYGAILFAANGALLKQIRYAANDQCTADCPLLGLEQGFANALTTQTGGKLVLTSLSPAAPNTEIDLADAFKPRLAKGSNGGILMTSELAFRTFTASGVEITAPSMLGKGKTQQKILAAIVAEDGNGFVVNQNIDKGKSLTRLEAFSESGAQLWKRTIADVGSAQVWANDVRVCVSKLNTSFSDATLGCFATATGAELSSNVIPNVAAPRIRTLFLTDGRLRVVYATGASGVKIVDVANDGSFNEINVVTNQIKSIIDIGASGGILIAATAPNSSLAIELIALLPSGAISFRRAIANNVSLNQISGRVLENSEVVISTPSQSPPGGTFDTVLLNAAGVERWAVASSRLSANDYGAKILADDKNVYLVRRENSNTKTRVYALSLGSGNAVWTQELKVAPDATTDLYVAPNSDELLVFTSSETGVQLSRLNSASGALLEQRFLDCKIARCTLRANNISSAGDFITVSETKEFGHKEIVLGRAVVTNIAVQISTDQAGLSGAWYTPQISGQGFFLEYFPQNKLLFAPWFTFANEFFEAGAAPNSDDVAKLRWYTLSGTVEPGAKVAQLEIRRNVAGAFNSAPITESTVVGTATLRARDCNRATLEFEFIPSEAAGKYGLLPLDRLAGGSAPCQLSNGQTLPGRDARTARGGFDGRQSGSWYQPQTAGQGFMMTVQPATDAVPGFFFGGWFTYDVGAPNDPTSQHWLTLSGEIPVNAQAGVVPVVIYRTLGGQLASVPTQNNAILGHGSVSFSGCASALLRYQFDDALIAGAFRARVGEINLQRLGACPAL